MFEYRFTNTFYAERAETGLKYTYNQGHLNRDNPKLAARYFLQAIDRVVALRQKYESHLKEAEASLPVLESLVQKPFVREAELQEMRSSLAGLEREIAVRIQKRQLAQEGEAAETKVIKMHVADEGDGVVEEQKARRMRRGRGMGM